MKTNGTQIILIRTFVLLFSLIISTTAFCQPDYDFRNSVLVSGTDKQIGAVYLFKNVKTGVDATVTIKNITGGVTLNNIDGASGYAEALQPVIDVAPLSSGYIEFDIDFLIAGTNTPMVQVEVPATPIDVDGKDYGNGIVNEFDVLQLTNGYVDYDMLGGELNMNITGPWVTGINTMSIDYPGVDTTPRQVMFTTVNAAISKFTFRTGANSTSTGATQRLRSVYFKKFKYPNSFLSTPDLISFAGVTKDKKVELHWNINTNGSIKEIIIEKASAPGQFSTAAEIWVNTESKSVLLDNFKDNMPLQGNIYYRLKIINAAGQVSYSNILAFRSAENNPKQVFKLYPSVVNDNVTVNISSDKSEQTSLQLFDLGGRAVYQKKIALQAGNNNVSVNGLGNLQQGAYVAVVKANSSIYSQKIMIQ